MSLITVAKYHAFVTINILCVFNLRNSVTIVHKKYYFAHPPAATKKLNVPTERLNLEICSKQKL